jgi:hypothetical protein
MKMATRSAIGFQEFDGTVTGIYCHWDGYLEGVGRTLVENYSDLNTVLALIDHGDVSSLDRTIGVAHPFSRFGTDLTDQQWESLFGGMTTFYTRDRGEDTPARDFTDADAFVAYYSDCEFFYLFDGHTWSYRTRRTTDFVPVAVELHA